MLAFFSILNLSTTAHEEDRKVVALGEKYSSQVTYIILESCDFFLQRKHQTIVKFFLTGKRSGINSYGFSFCLQSPLLTPVLQEQQHHHQVFTHLGFVGRGMKRVLMNATSALQSRVLQRNQLLILQTKKMATLLEDEKGIEMSITKLQQKKLSKMFRVPSWILQDKVFEFLYFIRVRT